MSDTTLKQEPVYSMKGTQRNTVQLLVIP